MNPQIGRWYFMPTDLQQLFPLRLMISFIKYVNNYDVEFRTYSVPHYLERYRNHSHNLINATNMQGSQDFLANRINLLRVSQSHIVNALSQLPRSSTKKVCLYQLY
jgi:hypothetical protein